LGLPSGVESVCSSVTVEIFWRRSVVNVQVIPSRLEKSTLTYKLAPSSSLISEMTITKDV